MKQKSYSIATPSFVSSDKSYQLKAFVSNLKSKVYSIKLSVISPFLENNKDYPIRAAAFSRYPGTVDENVYTEADRINTVDTVLSRYLEGNRRSEERGAILYEAFTPSRLDTIQAIILDVVNPVLLNEIDTQIISLMDFSKQEIDYFIAILTVEDLSPGPYDAQILEEYKAQISERAFTVSIPYEVNGVVTEHTFDANVLQDEQAVKLLTLIHGSLFIDQLKAEVVRKEIEGRFLRQETAQIITRIINGRYEEFIEFDAQGKLTYMPELFVANMV
jgi:hypothetical protein